jgi:glycosyltransferase involved in cell wall biosynthesis
MHHPALECAGGFDQSDEAALMSFPTAAACVVIAAKNASQSVARAVQSALREPRAAEVIVVAGASADATAEAAQEMRARSLRRAAAFPTLVQHLKDKAPLKALGTALSDPGAIRHFGMPIAARLKRLRSVVRRRETETGRRAPEQPGIAR